MQFSDTSNYTGILQRCEDYTGIGHSNITGDTTTLKKFTSHTNEALYDIIGAIMRSQDGFDWDDVNYSTFPIGTFALTTDRDYNLPTSLNFLSLKRLDITYDGTNWYRAQPVDSSQFDFGLGNDTEVDGHFSKTQPKYDPKSNGFWLYPRASSADVTAGASARIEFTREFDEFASTDTTQEPPIDRQFHDLIAIGASLKWAIAKDANRASNLKALWDEGMENLKRHYGSKNKDEQLIMDPYIPSYT